jgi:hypothetical protein
LKQLCVRSALAPAEEFAQPELRLSSGALLSAQVLAHTHQLDRGHFALSSTAEFSSSFSQSAA